MMRPSATPANEVDLAQAAAIVRTANRILVIGCSGGGKSTLAQAIAVRFGLTFISIDRDILWLPGWVQRGREEQRERIVERIARDRWIMDGTNPSTFDIRVPRSDIVIWVRVHRLVCLWSVFARWFRYFGTTRPEMAAGCIEKVDWEFVHFIWTHERLFSPRIIKGLEVYGPDKPVLQLKSRRQIRQLLDLIDLPA